MAGLRDGVSWRHADTRASGVQFRHGLAACWRDSSIAEFTCKPLALTNATGKNSGSFAREQ